MGDFKNFQYVVKSGSPDAEILRYAKKNDVDVILGVGGGSSIDVAKAISVGVTHEGDAWAYRIIDGKPIEDKLLPIIAVTTTAGTGTEVTPVSVITNSAIP